MQVWDTAGQEQFQSLAASYYRKAGGVIIVYDAQNRTSFESLPTWLLQVHENAPEGIVTMIIAAKSRPQRLSTYTPCIYHRAQIYVFRAPILQ